MRDSILPKHLQDYLTWKANGSALPYPRLTSEYLSTLPELNLGGYWDISDNFLNGYEVATNLESLDDPWLEIEIEYMYVLLRSPEVEVPDFYPDMPESASEVLNYVLSMGPPPKDEEDAGPFCCGLRLAVCIYLFAKFNRSIELIKGIVDKLADDLKSEDRNVAKIIERAVLARTDIWMEKSVCRKLFAHWLKDPILSDYLYESTYGKWGTQRTQGR